MISEEHAHNESTFLPLSGLFRSPVQYVSSAPWIEDDSSKALAEITLAIGWLVRPFAWSKILEPKMESQEFA